MNASILSARIPTRQKLTTRLFSDLPAGAFVVSNLYLSSGLSVFAVKLPEGERDFKWELAKASGAAGKLCVVVWNQEEFSQLKFAKTAMPLIDRITRTGG